MRSASVHGKENDAMPSLYLSYFGKIMRRVSSLALLVAIALASKASFSANLHVEVHDASGAALADAVVYAIPEHPSNIKPSAITEISQSGRKFVPLVTALQTGSQVSFPNNDTVRHHIYSFSPAKKFEMKLYSGVPSENVLFDKAGTVVLGCNIHDKMISYIHVVDSPYFAKSDASGKVTLSNLPKGAYQLKLWHYSVPSNNGVTEQALQMGTEGQNLTVKLATKAVANVVGSDRQTGQYNYAH